MWLVVDDHVRRLDMRVGERGCQLGEECLEAFAAGTLAGRRVVIDGVLRKGLDCGVDVPGIDALGKMLLSGDVVVYGHGLLRVEVGHRARLNARPCSLRAGGVPVSPRV